MTLIVPAALAAVTLCSVAGGVMFQRFAELRDPVWLIAGFVAYNFSNIGWVLLIDQAGLARAATLSSAVTILALTVLGYILGEDIRAADWLAALLVVGALAIPAFAFEAEKSSQPVSLSASDGGLDDHAQ